MGTGVVSSGLALDGHERLSRAVLAVAAALWIVLAVRLAAQAVRDPSRLRRQARSPVALTTVAATSVLGVRLALLGWSWVPVAMLCLALALWVGLLGPVLAHWTKPVPGSGFLLAVSTESLAVLMAVLAGTHRLDWLLDVALLFFLLGLGFYGFVAAGFNPRELLLGRGDHWIAGGALAIATLAAARLTLGAHVLGEPGHFHALVRDASIVLWVLTLLWLPVLIAAELLSPRLGYDLRRWSTVFPVGMYATSSFVVGAAASTSVPTEFARTWVWIAVAVWAAVAAAHAVALVPRPVGSAARLTVHGRPAVPRSTRINVALVFMALAIVLNIVLLFSGDTSAGWPIAAVVLLGTSAALLLTQRREP